MKTVITTHFSFAFSKFFTQECKQFVLGAGDTSRVKAKFTAEKTLKRAGATPLFRLSAAQKVRGVAPALRHAESCRVFFPQ
jgi:hypothetical protein